MNLIRAVHSDGKEETGVVPGDDGVEAGVDEALGDMRRTCQRRKTTTRTDRHASAHRTVRLAQVPEADRLISG